MRKLLGLLGERLRRQAGDDLVRFFHWGNFDKTAICAAKVGQDTMRDQKAAETFDVYEESCRGRKRCTPHRLKQAITVKSRNYVRVALYLTRRGSDG
jgi:hypothetical protein